jgi:uncharacterized protein RhaS with RHS repeats
MLTDHLETVRDLVNNSGTIVNHFTYDSFGKVLTTSGTVDTCYKFTGRELDAETGLYYYRARYFDANVGRFIGQSLLLAVFCSRSRSFSSSSLSSISS